MWWHALAIGFVLGLGTGIFVGVTLMRVVALRAMQVVDKLITPSPQQAPGQAEEVASPQEAATTAAPSTTEQPLSPHPRVGVRGSRTMWDGRTEKILKERHDRRTQQHGGTAD